MKLWQISALATCTIVLASTGFGQRDAKPGPTQSSLASKTIKFGTATKADAAKAIQAKNLAEGTKNAGKTGSFLGSVASIYSPKSHQDVYIDFSNPWQSTISGHVLAADFAKLPNLSTLKGKEVVISGTFSLHDKTHPEIVVKSAGQIKIVK